MAKRLRLYLDTTVWNYPFADDSPVYQKDTLEFFDKVQLGFFEVFTSEQVIGELNAAPEPRLGQITELLKKVNPAY